MPLKLKRVYEPAAKEDGHRILVDRLWPRGVSKATARVDEWRRDLAPSDALRKAFCHDPAKWTEFKRRYAAELKPQAAALAEIAARARRESVTLLFGAKDETYNNAVALKEVIGGARSGPKRPAPQRRAKRPARR
jgi:uncharacterized protein YeaO (DUF488 family)